MSEINEPTPQETVKDADAVLSLQETPSEEQDVEAHALAWSSFSGSIIGSC